MGNRKNIVVEVGSILVFALGVFALTSILTYHSADPSMLSQVIDSPRNACGRVGAYFSSFVLNCFGMGGFIVPAALFAVAATIHKRTGWLSVLGALGNMAA